MDELQYTLLTEVIGRWQADIIENFLRSEEIDVVLVQDGVAHSTLQTTFAPVKIYVPKASARRARNLMNVFDKTQDDMEEN
jgi:hypothetical protein